MEGSNFKWQSQAFSESHLSSNAFFIMCVMMYAGCEAWPVDRKEWAISASALWYPPGCFNILKKTFKSYPRLFYSFSHQVHQIYLTWSMQSISSLLVKRSIVCSRSPPITLHLSYKHTTVFLCKASQMFIKPPIALYTYICKSSAWFI